MQPITRSAISVTPILIFALSTGCASTFVAGQASSEDWYDEHPMAGAVLLPADLALGLPFYVVGFLVADPEIDVPTARSVNRGVGGPGSTDDRLWRIDRNLEPVAVERPQSDLPGVAQPSRGTGSHLAG